MKAKWINRDISREHIADKIMDMQTYLRRLQRCRRSITPADDIRITLISKELETLSDSIREGRKS